MYIHCIHVLQSYPGGKGAIGLNGGPPPILPALSGSNIIPLLPALREEDKREGGKGGMGEREGVRRKEEGKKEGEKGRTSKMEKEEQKEEEEKEGGLKTCRRKREGKTKVEIRAGRGSGECTRLPIPHGVPPEWQSVRISITERAQTTPGHTQHGR